MGYFYEFSGKGMPLAAVVVVLAPRITRATRLAKEWAIANSVDPDSLELRKRTPAERSVVVYGWNGDY
jgi:hypothetical protein